MSAESTDRPNDIISITTSAYGAAEIRSNLFRGEMTAHLNEDVEMGIQVHQDGSDIGISAGTTWECEDDKSLHTYHGITADQAREIAAALEQAADLAEAKAEQEPAEPESFIRRLIS